MQELAEASPSVAMPVPIGLMRFQDTITALTRPGDTGQLPICEQLRQEYAANENEGLSYLRLSEARAVYEASMQGLDEAVDEKNFRVYLDFLHMQGVLTHDNSAALEDLVVIDPMWLLKTFTRIIRNNKLHTFPEDAHLPGPGEKALFETGALLCHVNPDVLLWHLLASSCVMRIGILYLDMLPHVWGMHNATLHMELVGLMLQAGLNSAIASAYSKARCSLAWQWPWPLAPAKSAPSSSHPCFPSHQARNRCVHTEFSGLVL